MPHMVELRDVHKTFGSFVALHDVNLTVSEGEFMTFLGPSGCGKTTCLRLISGFDSPTSGAVLIGGKDVTRDPPYRRDVNQVFQSYALFPHLTIYENIAFGLRMKKMPAAAIKKRADRVIEMTALESFVARMPSELSGGQRQRVALARAIVCEPKVLLLDEPLSALDAKLRMQMRIELKNLQRRLGMTFIFVTHDQEEALTLSDRIAVINKGAVEQVGASSEIYYHPSTRFVASFIGETNIIKAKILSWDGERMACETEGGLRMLVHSTANFAREDVLLSLRPEKIRLSRSRPAGENVFRGAISLEIFKGAIDQLTVLTEAGFELGAILANDGDTEDEFREGERVYFRIQPADISIITD